MHQLFAFIEGILRPSHIVIILIVGILLFGKRLPDIGKSLGRTLMEFKKGIKGLEDDIEPSASAMPPSAQKIVPPQRFDTPPQKPNV
jgi:sec-independent protein translocase protein TatA